MIVCEQTSLIATDVKVAPGGTENVDTEIYEAVVSQAITEPQVSLQSNRYVTHPRPSYILLMTLLVLSAARRASVPWTGPREHRAAEDQPDI